MRIFVPNGDPERIRIIDRISWTAVGVVFPRTKWPDGKHRSNTLTEGPRLYVERLSTRSLIAFSRMKPSASDCW